MIRSLSRGSDTSLTGANVYQVLRDFVQLSVAEKITAELSGTRHRNGLEEVKRMYCSSCGVAVAQSLSYCNYCGAKLNAAKGESASRSPEVKPETLVAAMVLVFVFGLGAITL